MLIKHKCIFIITILILGALTHCGKSTNPRSEDELIGNWRWLQTSGGIGGWTTTPDSVGYDKMLSFHLNKNYELFRWDSTMTVIAQGSYYTKHEPVWSSNDSGDVVYMDNFPRSEYLISNDTLYLTEICYDCFTHIYVRLGDI